MKFYLWWIIDKGRVFTYIQLYQSWYRSAFTRKPLSTRCLILYDCFVLRMDRWMCLGLNNSEVISDLILIYNCQLWIYQTWSVMFCTTRKHNFFSEFIYTKRRSFEEDIPNTVLSSLWRIYSAVSPARTATSRDDRDSSFWSCCQCIF